MSDIKVIFSQSKGVINPNIYGHFAEHIGGMFRGGVWVGENSLVENVNGFRKALIDSFKKLNPPVLRWPGGCFAETYDWRDGIGPCEKRPKRIGWWYPDDHRVEDNAVGTHEFMSLCRMVGAQPYFAANMTTVPALHVRNWIEYCNMPAGLTTLADERAQNGDTDPFDVEFWGIGNENWDGGGRMSAEMCAREYMRYATICASLSKDLKFIACGANGHDVAWTRELMQTLFSKGANPYGVSVHYYCGTAGTPQSFSNDQWYQLLHQANYMQNIIDDHRAAMDEFDPERKIGMLVDEWGCWHSGGTGPSNGYNLFEQQSNMRDAVVAALTLNIFNNRCDIVCMANIAQLCNNLHSLYLAAGEHFVETPNYFVFDMFKTHQGAKQLELINTCGQFDGGEAFRKAAHPLERVSASASQAENGSVTITLANTDLHTPIEIALSGVGGSLAGMATITTLYSEDAHTCNTFENPTAVQPTSYTAPFTDGGKITLPAAGIVAIHIAR